MKKINWGILVQVLALVLFMALLALGQMKPFLILYVLSLVGALFFGRFYCGYICPINTLMKPVEWLAGKLGLKKRQPPGWLAAGWLPWVAVAGSLALLITGEKILENSIPVMVLWIAAGVLMVPFFHPAVFHVMVCPFGALQKIFGRSVFRSEEVDPRSCIGCRKCEKVCPSKAIVVQKEEKKARIQKDLCFQCKACEGVCPTDSIHYR